MICRNCVEYDDILHIQNNLVMSALNLDFKFKEYSVFNKDEDFICEECGGTVYKGEYYIADYETEDIYVEIGNQIAKLVVEEIVACEECGHGAFMNDLHHSIERIFDEEDEDSKAIYESFDYSTTLSDLIYNVSGFDEKFNKYVISEISCPYCKSGSGEDYEDKTDYGKWNEYTTVYTEEDIENFNKSFYGDEKTYNSVRFEINTIADVLTFNQIVDLKNEYINNPMLIQNSSIKKIIELIKSLYNRSEGYVLDDFFSLYRGRINHSKSVYDKKDMWEPPVKIASQGRYNPVGFPVLYLGNSKAAIKQEVKNDEKSFYNIGIFKIKRPLTFFSINRIFDYNFTEFINEEVPENDNESAFKVQYIVTNIISLIIKDVGYNGVVYLSTKNPKYLNFAVLKYEKNKDIEILNVVQEV